MQEVFKIYDSGRYEIEIMQCIAEAEALLAKCTPCERSIIIFDIDDTVLSHLEFTKNCYEQGLPTDDLFDDYIVSMAAQAIPTMYRWYKTLLVRGFKIVFLSARKMCFLEETRSVLEKNGFLHYECILLRTPEEKSLYGTNQKFKEAKRKELHDAGYRIVACVGDQPGDLEGEYTGFKIKLPNYFYQSR